jgi:hypothetical protein
MPCSVFLFFGKGSEPLKEQDFSLEPIWATRPIDATPSPPTVSGLDPTSQPVVLLSGSPACLAVALAKAGRLAMHRFRCGCAAEKSGETSMSDSKC